MSNSQGSDQGFAIETIPHDVFRNFARRYAHSAEIGPIGICLDSGAPEHPDATLYVVGLKACGKLCAAACFELYPSKVEPSAHILKLDSVIVNPRLRQRGLAGLLVTQIFQDLVGDKTLNIRRIYAHSVHPATVALLKRLSFKDPLPTGAPISSITIERDERDTIVAAWREQVRGPTDQKKLNCELCRTKSRRARPWCLPDSA